jgi:FixJ family two-component response regulator
MEERRLNMTIDQALLRRSAPPVSKQVLEVEKPLVIIVDDDAAIREALSELILSAGFEPVSFGSTRELLDADVLDRPGCLILDVRMPGASGLDLQRQLAGNGNPKPIIFLTGHGDIPMTVQAMKAGAVDFLTKPVRDQTLLDAVIAGVAMDVARRTEAAIVKHSIQRLETLTPREREVFHKVARGKLNKQIAFDLGISEVTVKLHRGNVMRKMEAASIGELIRTWETLPASVREAGQA